MIVGLGLRRLAAATALSLAVPACQGSDDASGERWPDAWVGQYYRATDVELGISSPSSPAFHFFHNVRLELGTTQLDYFVSTGDHDHEGSTVFSPKVEDDVLRILPTNGKDSIDWPPFAEGHAWAELRPGADCGELTLTMGFTASEEITEAVLRRGRICLEVPCNPAEGINCTVTVDLCADDPSPTKCEAP